MRLLVLIVCVLAAGCTPSPLQQQSADACANHGGVPIWSGDGLTLKQCALPCVPSPAEAK